MHFYFVLLLLTVPRGEIVQRAEEEKRAETEVKRKRGGREKQPTAGDQAMTFYPMFSKNKVLSCFDLASE